MLEYLRCRYIQTFFLRACSNSEDQQRIRPQLKDTICDANAVEHQHVGPYLSKLLLFRRSRSSKRPLREVKTRLEKGLCIRQTLAIYLSIRRPGKLWQG